MSDAARTHDYDNEVTGTAARRLATSILPTIFLLSLAVPLIVELGGLRLSIYRVLLLLLVIPVVFKWVGTRSIKPITTDWAVLLLCAWAQVSFFAHYGLAAVEPAGIYAVETLGAYFLGRVYVRNIAGMSRMVKAYLITVLLLLPFALVETATGTNVIMRVFDQVGRVLPDVPKQPRWGLDRVQGPFEHPILYGVFAGGCIALVYYVLGAGRARFKNIFMTGTAFFTAALSLSSGPLTAMMAQGGLIGWDTLFRRYRRRWVFLIVATVLAYAVIEIGSNRSAPAVFISYFAFSEHTAFNRILIWRYGSQSVLDFPWIGVGLGGWARPEFMSGSMDMFWLIVPVRHGILAGFFLSLAVLAALWQAARRQITDPVAANHRTGYCVMLVGFIIAGWTVAYYNTTYVLFMFLLGAGGWIIESYEKAPRKTWNTDVQETSGSEPVSTDSRNS